MTRPRLWLILAVACAPFPVAAETLYVTDQITVALRADAAPDAAVLKTVSTGAALELLERSGSFAKVRDNEGTEGWVEATALAPQPPAAAQLRTLRAELERTRVQLVNAQTQLDKARAPPAASPDAAKLKAELAEARDQLAATQAELNKKDDEIAALAVSAAAAAAQAPPPPPERAAETGFSLLWAGIAFAMLGLGFVGGIVWVKESIRRRMGGMYLRI